MKLFFAGALCMAFLPSSGAQATHPRPTPDTTQTAQVKPKEVLPQTTLDFKPLGNGLPLPNAFAYINHPVCDSDGAFYMNAEVLPSGERQIIALSPTDKDAVTNYTMSSILGLVNVQPRLMDAKGVDLYVLAGAEKSDDLINHDVKPGSREAWKYGKDFILHFHGKPSSPEVIPLDLPFFPEQFAATSDGKFVFLGFDRTNQIRVLAVVNSSGELDHYMDAYQFFGTDKSILANAPQRLKDHNKNMPISAAVDSELVLAQFVHYRGSLLLLMPGSKPKILTIRGGGVQATTLHLPAGLEAESLIPSNTSWLVRATDGTKNGRKVIVMVDPSDGKALRIIHSPNLRLNEITCVHDGDYYGIGWPQGWARGKNKKKVFLMEASQ